MWRFTASGIEYNKAWYFVMHCSVFFWMTVVSVDYLLLGEGPFFTYQCAMSIRRHLWVSNDFRLNRQGISQFLDRLIANSGWKILTTQVQFVQQCKRKGPAPWALLMDAEVVRACTEIQNSKNIHNLHGFIASLCKLKPGSCRAF